MSFRLHGNYCGPGWSAGQWQSSVVSNLPAVDAFDQSCKEHDAAYAQGSNLASADLQFAYNNITSLSPLRVVSGVGIGLQGVGRLARDLVLGSDISLHNSFNPKNDSPKRNNKKRENFETIQENIMPKRNMRAKMEKVTRQYALEHPTARYREQDLLEVQREVAALKAKLLSKVAAPGKRVRAMAKAFGTSKVAAAPVSIGTSITSAKPTTRTIGDGVCITGREFLLPVTQVNNANWQVGAIAPLHPAYYPASTMGTMCRAYQFYRYKSLVVHFVTKEPTSTNGEVLLTYSPNVLEPLDDGANAQFLNRAMTRAGAVLGPIWQNHSMQIPTDNTYRKVDAFNSTVFNDNMAGECQVFTLAGSADVSGYMLIDYELEFKTAMFTPHSARIPISSGPGSSYTATLTGGFSGDSIIFTSGALAGSNSPGTIYRFICDIDQSTIASGSFATSFMTRIDYAVNTLATSGVTRVIPLRDGTQLYFVYLGASTFAVYTSYESALGGDGSGQVFGNSTFGAVSLVGNSYVVRFNSEELITAD